MEENISQVFHQYAEDELKNHFSELNTRYQNESVDNGTKQKAFENHRRIFKEELDEKMQSLLKDDKDESLKNKLETIKQTYLTKWSLNQP